VNDDEHLAPRTIVVPTELERSDGFIDLAVFAGTVLVVWDLALNHVPLLAMLPLVLIVAVLTLTGEPAADVPYIGAVASGIRSKLGLRRAHEWVLAFGHYFTLAVWPEWMERWQKSRISNSRLLSAVRTTRLLLRWLNLSGAPMKCKHLRFWKKS